MAFGKEQMSSYVDRGNKLIADGKTQEVMKLVMIEKVKKANRY